MQRKWTETQIAAGYDQQIWGPIPDSNCAVLGVYTYIDEAGERRLIDVVLKTQDTTTGVPEIALVWDEEAGIAVTVLDEATAVAYLLQHGATKVSEGR